MDTERRIATGAAAVGAAFLALALFGLVLGFVAFVGPFAPERWVNDDGRRANPFHYQEPDVPYESSGPSHCRQEGVTFITFRGGGYVRDRNGTLDLIGRGLPTYERDATLPSDAETTGWHRGSASLWLSRFDVDADGVHRNLYIVWPDRVERLPQLTLGCM